MCGIAGNFNLSESSGHISGQVDDVKTMIKAQNHRGPDHTAYFSEKNICIGHNRLSIIDLTSNSHQPFIYEDLVIVFNGEIYNYKEIKAELIELGYSFRTQSDTEVILASYIHWGKEALEHFIGMWSFVIWDKNKSEIFCSVDRFGIKPLYYYTDENNIFYFASEIKAFYNLKSFNKKINNNYIKRFLSLGWMHYKEETIFENCFALEPATSLIISKGQITKEKYWSIDYSKNHNISFDKATSKFSKLINDSLKLHLRSDVKLAFSLSGGIDSSSLVSLCSKENLSKDSISSYHIYYDNHKFNEKKYAQSVVQKYKEKINPKYYSPNEDDIKKDLDHFLYHQEFPVGGSSPFSQYYLNKIIKKDDIKVLIEGQGADEYLGGYLHGFFRLFHDNILNKNIISEITGHYKKQELTMPNLVKRLLKTGSTFVYSESEMAKGEFRWLTPNIFKNTDIPIDIEVTGETRLDQFLNGILTTTTLPSLLQIADRNSMAFSIEARVPFLDHRLVEFCASLPNKYLMSQGITKRILRESMKPYLPKEIYKRYDKVGFVTPGESIWLRGSLSFLLEKINFQQFEDLGIYSNKLKNIIDDYIAGNDKHAKLVWRIAILNKWLSTDKKALCPNIELHEVCR
mgnify:CR=1 FL=1